MELDRKSKVRLVDVSIALILIFTLIIGSSLGVGLVLLVAMTAGLPVFCLLSIIFLLLAYRYDLTHIHGKKIRKKSKS